jgi:cytochrome c553
MLILRFIFIWFVFFCATAFAKVPTDEQLKAAVTTDNVELVEVWLADGGDVNHRFKRSGTLLQYAINQKSKNVTSLLLEKGADVNGVTRSNSIPPLSISFSDDSDYIYQELINLGADVNLPDQFGETPIFYAFRNPNRQAIVPLLIEKGADINHANKLGDTPFLSAFRFKNAAMLQTLLDNGAVIDAEMLAEKSKGVCGHCHSDNGPGVTLAVWGPHLAGQHEDYLLKQMVDYHMGARGHKHMNEPSKVLIEPIVQALASHFSARPRAVNPSTASAETLKAGEGVYTSKCLDCHGKDGIETRSGLTPAIAGLFSTYVKNQLTNFKNGTRKNDADGEMRAVASELSEQEIHDVSEYVQNL